MPIVERVENEIPIVESVEKDSSVSSVVGLKDQDKKKIDEAVVDVPVETVTNFFSSTPSDGSFLDAQFQKKKNEEEEKEKEKEVKQNVLGEIVDDLNQKEVESVQTTDQNNEKKEVNDEKLEVTDVKLY